MTTWTLSDFDNYDLPEAFDESMVRALIEVMSWEGLHNPTANQIVRFFRVLTDIRLLEIFDSLKDICSYVADSSTELPGDELCDDEDCVVLGDCVH